MAINQHSHPLGQISSVKTDDFNTSQYGFRDFKITGVIQNAPENSTIQYDFLVSISYYETAPDYQEDWGRCDMGPLFVQLAKNVDLENIKSQIDQINQVHFQEQYLEQSDRQYQLQPLNNVHWDEPDWFIQTSKPVYSYTIGGIALLVLLIACINFVNLSIGLFNTRFKEVGVRKVLGAFQRQIVVQMLFESLLMNFLALIMGITIAQISLPLFNGIIGSNLAFDFIASGSTIIFLLLLMLLIGVLAGL